MQLSKTTLLLSLLQLLPTAFAQTACTQSSASTYNDPNDPCGAAALARDDTGCVQQYCSEGGSSDSLNACFCLAGVGENCGTVSTKMKRADFTCSSSETCYINPADGGLFCLDDSTGDYIGESGDSGNVNTGAYTAAPGGGTTSVDLSTATSLDSSTATSVDSSTATSSDSEPSATSSFDSTKSTSATTRGGSSVPVTSVPTATRSSATVESTTSTAGMGRVSAGAVVGALGLVAGLVL